MHSRVAAVSWSLSLCLCLTHQLHGLVDDQHAVLRVRQQLAPVCDLHAQDFESRDQGEGLLRLGQQLGAGAEARLVHHGRDVLRHRRLARARVACRGWAADRAGTTEKKAGRR